MKYLAAIFSLVFSCTHSGQVHAQSANPSRVMIELGNVDDDSVETVKKALATFAADPAVTDVYLRINSNGGGIQAGLDLIQSFDHYPKKLFCVADTHAYSMGMTVLESCPFRLMTTRSTAMMHECLVQGASGNEHDLMDLATSCHAMTESMISIAAKRMKLSAAQIRIKITGQQWWLDATEALKVGAIDALIDPEELPPLTLIEQPKESLMDLLRGR